MWPRSQTSGLMIGSIWRSSVGVGEMGDERERAAARRVHGVDDLEHGPVTNRYGPGRYGPMRTATRGLPTSWHCNPNVVDGDIPTSRRQWSAWPRGRRRRHASSAYRQVLRPLFPRSKPSARQHVRRPGRPLERAAPQDGDLRLDRVRRRRLRHRRRRRRQEAQPTTSAPASPAAADQLVADHFPKDARRERPRPGAARAARPRTRTSARPSTTRSPPSAAKPRVAERQVAVRQGQREPDLQGRPVRPRELQGPRRRGRRPRSAIDPVVAAVDARRRRRTRRLRRRVRRRERRQGAVEGVRGRLQEGREALAADHAADPRRRLRRARRRRRPAAARPDRRDGGARPRRAAEPDRPAGRRRSARSCCWSAWRSASTTRSSTCAASARSRPRGAGKLEAVHTAAATSGRAVLVSGFTVMVAMAGMFLAGDRDVHLARHRRDHRRRRRHDRLGHGRPGDARRARRPRRQGPGPVPAPPASAPTARAASGTPSSTASSAPGRCRPASPPALLVALAIPASACTPCRPAPTTCRASSRS